MSIQARKPKSANKHRNGRPRKASRTAPKAASGVTTQNRAPKAAGKGSDRQPNDTKQQVCLAMLRRPGGASLEELQVRTGWQAHSVRGFLAGAVKRKLGLTLQSEKSPDRSRRYYLDPHS